MAPAENTAVKADGETIRFPMATQFSSTIAPIYTTPKILNAFFAVICLKIHVISRAVRITAAITQIHQCAAPCSTATRYFRFNFVANKDKSPAYYNNGGNDYQIRFKTDDGQGGGSGGEGNITFYDKNTATLSLSMTGGWSSNLTYTYAGDGSRDISDNPGGVTSLDISGFTLRLQRASADLEIKSVSVQYKVFEEGSGSEGQWNTLNYDFQEDEGGNILAKKYTGTTSTPDLTYGLKQGPTYILDVKYQVVDKSDNYYFFKPSRVYKFPVNDSGGGGESVRGDLNGDGEVSMPDVMFLIQRILNGKFPDE